MTQAEINETVEVTDLPDNGSSNTLIYGGIAATYILKHEISYAF